MGRGGGRGGAGGRLERAISPHQTGPAGLPDHDDPHRHVDGLPEAAFHHRCCRCVHGLLRFAAFRGRGTGAPQPSGALRSTMNRNALKFQSFRQ